GGIEYDVPCRMYYSDPSQNLHIDLKKGEQTLDGESAEGLVRFRKRADNVKYSAEELADYNKVYNGSDLKRMDVQQNFIKEVIKQKASMATLNKINDILAIVFKRLSTNITAKTTIQIGTNLGNMSSEKIKNFKIHVVDTTDGSGDVLYTENITDNTSKKNYPSEEVLEKYFSSNASDWKNEISEIATAEPTENTTTIEPVENQIATKAPVITEAPVVEPTVTPEIVPTPTKTKRTFIIKTPTPTPVVEPTTSPVETNTDIPISW
ncbi:MAG: LCP family protein, partial [Clostridiales bacterium]